MCPYISMHCIMHTAVDEPDITSYHTAAYVFSVHIVWCIQYNAEVQVYGFILCLHMSCDALEQPISACHRISRSKSGAPGKCDLNWPKLAHLKIRLENYVYFGKINALLRSLVIWTHIWMNCWGEQFHTKNTNMRLHEERICWNG